MTQPVENRLLQTIKALNDQKFALDQAAIVATTDARGRITYVNQKFIEISKYSRQELLGQDHYILNSGHHPKGFFTDMWATISSGEVWRGEIKNRAKDGTYYWVYTTIVPFLDDTGRPYQYTAIRTDITETIEMRGQLEQERARTLHAEKMASLGQMAAGIAHELGNPIAAITAWLDVVSSAAHDGSLVDLDLESTIDSVKTRAQQMQGIITGLLTYARDGSRDPIETVNVSAVLQKTLSYCGYKLRNQTIEIRNKIGVQPVFCRGRESEIAQVLVNLLTNAADAIADSPKPWIEFDAAYEGNRVKIFVTDSGTGIPPEIAQSIFDPFFTTKSKGNGTGLGLSIVKNIIEGLDGTLSLDSENAHTRFVVELPKAE